MTNPSFRKWGRGLLWAALAAQALLATRATQPWRAGDTATYLSLAGNLARGCFGILRSGICEPDALRPPGYPLIVAALVHGVALPLRAVALVQVGLYLLSIFLMERLLARLRISAIPLLVAAIIYPFGAIYSAPVMTEAWATVAISALAFLICAEDQTSVRAIAVGLICGVAALIRSDLLLLPLLVSALIYLRQRSSNDPRQALGRALMPIAAAALLLSPYIIWNARHFGKPSPAPVASAVGNTLYLAVWQSRLSHEDLEPMYRQEITSAVAASGLVPEMARLNGAIGAPPMTMPFNPAAYSGPQQQIASSQIFGQAAMERIKAAPARYAAHVAANLWLLWNTSVYPPALPDLVRLALRIISALIFVGGMAGLLIALRSTRLRRELLPAAALLLYLPAIHIWLHTEARYTAAARPLLLLFVAVLVSFVTSMWRERQSADTKPASELS